MSESISQAVLVAIWDTVSAALAVTVPQLFNPEDWNRHFTDRYVEPGEAPVMCIFDRPGFAVAGETTRSATAGGTELQGRQERHYTVTVRAWLEGPDEEVLRRDLRMVQDGVAAAISAKPLVQPYSVAWVQGAEAIEANQVTAWYGAGDVTLLVQDFSDQGQVMR